MMMMMMMWMWAYIEGFDEEGICFLLRDRVAYFVAKHPFT